MESEKMLANFCKFYNRKTLPRLTTSAEAAVFCGRRIPSPNDALLPGTDRGRDSPPISKWVSRRNPPVDLRKMGRFQKRLKITVNSENPEFLTPLRAGCFASYLPHFHICLVALYKAPTTPGRRRISSPTSRPINATVGEEIPLLPKTDLLRADLPTPHRLDRPQPQ
jgi:hypothetical protein